MGKDDLDKDLQKSLQQARKKPRNFAIIAQGTTPVKLIVSKKPIKAGELTDAKKEFKGNLIVKGIVTGGDGPELLFQVLEEPSIQLPKLKEYLKETGGVTLKPRFQVVADVAEIDDDEPEGAVEAAAPIDEAIPPAPPAPEAPAEVVAEPPAGGDAATFTARLKALKPDLDKVLAANVSVSQEAKVRTGEAATFARKADFGEANRVLGQVEELVRTGLQEIAGRGTGSSDAAAVFTARLKALKPDLDKLFASKTPAGEEAKQQAGEAATFARNKEFEQANGVLDQLEKIVKGASEATDPAAVWQKRREELESQYLAAVRSEGALNPEAEKIVGRIKVMWTYATEQAEAGGYEKALAALGRLEKEGLFAQAEAAKAMGSGVAAGTVDKRKFLLTRWQKIGADLRGELNKLKKEIAAQEADDDPDDLADGFDEYLQLMLDEMQDEIDDAINAGDMGALKGLRNRVTQDEVVKHLVENPFVEGTNFQALVLDALDEVESTLAA